VPWGPELSTTGRELSILPIVGVGAEVCVRDRDLLKLPFNEAAGLIAVRAKLEELFGADVRALAVLRIGLAWIILIDLVQRSSDLVLHYSDLGVLPRADLLHLAPRRSLLSIHVLSGAWQVQALLFVAAALCALALLIGYRTRLATVASWFLFVSLNSRNPMVLLGGDVLIRVVLFWAIFLPLGARYSVDSALLRSPKVHGGRVLSAATVAYLVQLVLVYWFTAFRKSDPEWHSEGTALYYALSLDHLTTPLGQLLLEFPALLKTLTHGVLWLEVVGPLLLFSPVSTTTIRSLTVLAFVLLHAGIGLTLRIGLFPWISALAMVVFLPSPVWDGLRNIARRLPWIARWGDQGYRLVARPRTSAYPLSIAAPPVAHGTPRSRIVGFGVLGLLLYVVLWNVAALPAPPFTLSAPLRSVGYVLRLDQSWNMFAPSPLKDDGWYVIPGRLRDGQLVDLFRNGAEVRWEKPDSVADTYPNTRWRRYMMILPNHLEYAPSYARYLCREWNGRHHDARRLEELEIVFVLERTLPDYRRSEPRNVSLYRHTCAGASRGR